MNPIGAEVDAAVRLAIAALVGLGVGLEREWSGHASGPNARFAGLRTFLLLGMLGGVSGLLIGGGSGAAGAVLIAGGMAISVGAYIMAARKPGVDIDGTTEAAALLVVALGALAGGGFIGLAAGAGSLVVLALSEKARLHWLVRRVGEQELRAALQFAVLALVILPLLPAGPFGGTLAIRPRSLWMIVLFFSALNFAGFLARRATGPRAGYALTGLLGGLISSTAVTLDFSRKSREEGDLGVPLAYGVIGASTVLIPRVIVVSTVLNNDVGLRLIWLLLLPAALGIVAILVARRRDHQMHTAAEPSQPDVQSPLRLRTAIQMAVAFQLALMVIAFIHQRWGTVGLYPTAAMLGLTDMDALTMSMSRAEASIPAVTAARAIAIGVLANTLLKLGVVVGIGSGTYRRVAALGLLGLGAASAAGLLLSRWVFAR